MPFHHVINTSISICCCLLFCLPAYAKQSITLYAAASLTKPVNEVVEAYQQLNNSKVIVVYAASSVLARQIAQGAPADLFFSANTKWTDYLKNKEKLMQNTTVELLGNSLVLVASKNNKQSATLNEIKIDADLNSNPLLDSLLNSLLHKNRMALGNPDHVPVGIYSKQALQHFNLWETIKHRLALASNARSVLAFVEKGATALGIVYKTGAIASSQVKIIGHFPIESYERIIYPLSIIKHKEKNKKVASFYHFLQSETALNIFSKNGFTHINNVN